MLLFVRVPVESRSTKAGIKKRAWKDEFRHRNCSNGILNKQRTLWYPQSSRRHRNKVYSGPQRWCNALGIFCRRRIMQTGWAKNVRKQTEVKLKTTGS